MPSTASPTRPMGILSLIQEPITSTLPWCSSLFSGSQDARLADVWMTLCSQSANPSGATYQFRLSQTIPYLCNGVSYTVSAYTNTNCLDACLSFTPVQSSILIGDSIGGFGQLVPGPGWFQRTLDFTWSGDDGPVLLSLIGYMPVSSYAPATEVLAFDDISIDFATQSV